MIKEILKKWGANSPKTAEAAIMMDILEFITEPTSLRKIEHCVNDARGSNKNKRVN